MKKAFSIFTVCIVLLSGLHFTVSTHLCGGSVVASKVSLSGSLASCGMENNKEACPAAPFHQFTHHCCSNQVNILSTVNIFTIPFSLQKAHYQIRPNNSFLHKSTPLYSPAFLKPSYTAFSPPGEFLPCLLSQANLCVFRI